MQVLVAPIVSEKATMVADKSNAVTFKVLQDASKPEIKAAVELMFKVEVKGVSVVNTKGKTKRFGKSVGRRDNVRKAYVTLKPGQELNLGWGGCLIMAVIKLKPTSPGRRGVVKVTRDHLYKGEPYAPLLEPQFQKPAATTTATSPPVTRAVGTSTTTVWSISVATRTRFRPRSSASSTTRTAPPISRWCVTPTVSAATSLRRATLRWVHR
jgi:large subunit ribosomal protein L23